MEEILFLGQVQKIGKVPPSTPAIRLWHRGMLEGTDPYGYPGGVAHRMFKLSFRGELFLRGVVRDNRVRIADSYHLPHMRGKMGTVLGYADTQTDAPGYDEWGYQNRWPTFNFRVDVKVDDTLGTWCFYKTTDLEGFFLTGK